MPPRNTVYCINGINAQTTAPRSGHCNTAAAILQLKRASVCLPRLQLASHVSTPKTPMIKNFNKITIYIAVCGLIVKIQLNKIFPKNVQ